ncbi:MAG TPA: hypothetical protein VH165_00725 [Kofleriaceae bacterium]|nr:hypothetical protein [Kofleriaceae bacterium]
MIATNLRIVAALAALAVAMAQAPSARAQSAEAETLFREAKRLLKKGQIAEACDKLEAADRLEPTAGTELNLADCREKNGQLATAWAAWVKAAATAKHAGDAERAAEARRRAAALEPKLIYLTIAVPADSRVDGLVIKRNDTVIDPALWDQRTPVDPAEYEISGEAPGYEPWSTSVVVKTKDKKVEVPALDKKPEPKHKRADDRPARRTADADGAAEPGDAPAASTAAVRASDTPHRWTGTRKLSLVLTLAGVAAAAGGGALALHARSVEHDADDLCPGTDCAVPTGVSLNKTARRDALYANIGFAGGGALVATAIVLWLAGGPSTPGAVSLVPTAGGDRAGLAVMGGF